MRINNNIQALNTYNRLTLNNTNLSKSLEKLSSGLRINRAGDDAAGLAISEKMRGQIRGLDQASRNAQDAISLIQTAEGALNETHSILQRMRELAVQAATDTNTDQDRQNIQDEITQLVTEIDRIRNTTEFNTKKLLDGSLANANNSKVANVNVNTYLKMSGSALTTVNAATLTALQDSNGNSLGIVAGDKITVTYYKNGSVISTNLNVGANTTLGSIESKVSSDFSIATTTGGIEAVAAASGYAGAIYGITITVKDSNGTVKSAATNALSAFQETTQADEKRTDGRATIQIGANSQQNLQVTVSDMGANALGVQGLQVKTQLQADIAVKVIDGAITKVSSQRSLLGAVQNRLEHTIANLGTSSENLTAAESRVRDVDMAKEMMSYTKNNILMQASTAMLAQANQLPQAVLQLLR